MSGNSFAFGNNGGGSGGIAPEVIEVTKSDFLSLVGADGLTFPATYKITDIEGFEGVFINAVSANKFEVSAGGNLLVPDYVASGTNLGQLDATNIQVVGDGEKIIWADHYWVNNSGGSVTPTILDNTTLDAPLTVVAKTATDYSTIQVECKVSEELIVTYVYNPQNATLVDISANSIEGIGANIYIYAAFNNQEINNSILTFAFNFASVGNEINLSENTYPSGNDIDQNSARFQNLRINGSGNAVKLNISSGNGRFDGIQLINASEFSGNEATGDAYNDFDCIQGFIQLFDLCNYQNNITSGNGSYIFDIRTGENSNVTNNLASGIYSGINDIDQMYQDEVDGNTFSGDFSAASQIFQNGYSKFNGHTVSGNSSGFVNIWQEFGHLTGFTLSSDDKYIQRVTLINAELKNANDIAISDLKICGKTANWDFATPPPTPEFSIDLTGFSTDINGETIEAGKGWFTISHDFGSSPLTSGSSVLYNLIPTGARVTTIKTFGNTSGGAGATLAFGLETDAANLLPAAVLATVNAGQTYDAVSAAATANRSLIITAGTNNVTGGSVTVYVEFVV